MSIINFCFLFFKQLVYNINIRIYNVGKNILKKFPKIG